MVGRETLGEKEVSCERVSAMSCQSVLTSHQPCLCRSHYSRLSVRRAPGSSTVLMFV